jgi:hypothetical protein
MTVSDFGLFLYVVGLPLITLLAAMAAAGWLDREEE